LLHIVLLLLTVGQAGASTGLRFVSPCSLVIGLVS